MANVYQFSAYNKLSVDEARNEHELAADQTPTKWQRRGKEVDIILEADSLTEAEGKAKAMVERDVYELGEITEIGADGRTVNSY